jgi:hypothetical protein
MVYFTALWTGPPLSISRLRARASAKYKNDRQTFFDNSPKQYSSCVWLALCHAMRPCATGRPNSPRARRGIRTTTSPHLYARAWRTLSRHSSRTRVSERLHARCCPLHYYGYTSFHCLAVFVCLCCFPRSRLTQHAPQPTRALGSNGKASHAAHAGLADAPCPVPQARLLPAYAASSPRPGGAKRA